MDIKDMLNTAFGMATSVKYWVKIGDEELREMTYLELGIFLTTNAERIETIKINTRD